MVRGWLSVFFLALLGYPVLTSLATLAMYYELVSVRLLQAFLVTEDIVSLVSLAVCGVLLATVPKTRTLGFLALIGGISSQILLLLSPFADPERFIVYATLVAPSGSFAIIAGLISVRRNLEKYVLYKLARFESATGRAVPYALTALALAISFFYLASTGPEVVVFSSIPSVFLAPFFLFIQISVLEFLAVRLGNDQAQRRRLFRAYTLFVLTLTTVIALDFLFLIQRALDTLVFWIVILYRSIGAALLGVGSSLLTAIAFALILRTATKIFRFLPRAATVPPEQMFVVSDNVRLLSAGKSFGYRIAEMLLLSWWFLMTVSTIGAIRDALADAVMVVGLVVAVLTTPLFVGESVGLKFGKDRRPVTPRSLNKYFSILTLVSFVANGLFWRMEEWLLLVSQFLQVATIVGGYALGMTLAEEYTVKRVRRSHRVSVG